MGHPVWQTVYRQDLAAGGCLPYPFSLAKDELALHDGLDDHPLFKAAIEQYRRDALRRGFERRRVTGPCLSPKCACEVLKPSVCTGLTRSERVDSSRFDAALRWLYTRHPCRYLGNRMDVSAWKAILLQDVDPLGSAVVFYQICHGL